MEICHFPDWKASQEIHYSKGSYLRLRNFFKLRLHMNRTKALSVMPRQVACKITKKSVLKLSLCQNQNFHRNLQKNSEFRQIQCQKLTNHKLACLFISRIVAQCPTSSHRCNQQKPFQCLKWIQTLYELNYSLKVSLLNRKSNSLLMIDTNNKLYSTPELTMYLRQGRRTTRQRLILQIQSE